MDRTDMGGRRQSSRAQLEGNIVPHAPISAFRPLPIVYGRERDEQVDTMAKRVLQSYVAASDVDRRLGERWYSREGHGTARSIAAGVDPHSDYGHLIRSMPSPRERQSLPQGPQEQLPETVHRKQYEQQVRRSAHGLAALSPQTPWEVDQRQAYEVSQMSDEDAARLRQGEHSFLKGTQLNRQTNARILKSYAIMHGHQEPEQALPQGKKRVKVSSFASNLADPDSDAGHVTVDFRAADVAHGRLLKTSTDRALDAPGRYAAYEDAYRRAARLANEQYPHLRIQHGPLSPMQMQATVWEADRYHQDRQLGGSRQGGHLHRGPGGRPLTREDLGKPIGQ